MLPSPACSFSGKCYAMLVSEEVCTRFGVASPTWNSTQDLWLSIRWLFSNCCLHTEWAPGAFLKPVLKHDNAQIVRIFILNAALHFRCMCVRERERRQMSFPVEVFGSHHPPLPHFTFSPPSFPPSHLFFHLLQGCDVWSCYSILYSTPLLQLPLNLPGQTRERGSKDRGRRNVSANGQMTGKHAESGGLRQMKWLDRRCRLK